MQDNSFNTTVNKVKCQPNCNFSTFIGGTKKNNKYVGVYKCKTCNTMGFKEDFTPSHIPEGSAKKEN